MDLNLRGRIKMPDYTYREFKVHYEIKPSENLPELYSASGYIECLSKAQSTHEKIDFSTEHADLSGARKEIKKMIEQYIDFEWDQFSKIQRDLSHKE